MFGNLYVSSFIIGICLLSSLQTILITLNYIENSFENNKLEITLIKGVLNCITQLFFFFNGNIFSYKTQLILGFILQKLTLAAIPLVIIFMKGTSAGYFFLIAVIAISGISDAFLQSSLHIFSVLSTTHLIAATTGCAFSGLLFNLIRFGTIYLNNEVDHNIIFYAISVIISLLGFILLLRLFKNTFFIIQFFPQGEISDEEYRSTINKVNEHLEDSETKMENRKSSDSSDEEDKNKDSFLKKSLNSKIMNDIGSSPKNTIFNINDEKDDIEFERKRQNTLLVLTEKKKNLNNIKFEPIKESKTLEEKDDSEDKVQEDILKQSKFKISCHVLRTVYLTSLTVLCSFLLTFTIFPSVCLNLPINFFHEKDSIEKKANFLIFFYNLFEVIGRFFVKFIKASRCSLRIISYSRLPLFPLLLYLLYNFKYDIIKSPLSDIISILFISILGFTNGYIVVMGIYYAPEKVENYTLKGKAVSFICFSIIFGTTLGGLISTFIKNIIKDNFTVS